MKTTVNKDIFDFLRQQHLMVLYDLAKSAHTYMYTDPNTSLVNLWKYSEAILKYIYSSEGIPVPETASHSERLELLLTNGIIHSKIYRILNYIWKKGNKAALEPNYGSTEDAKTSLKCAFYLGVWLKQIYGNRLIGLPLYFDPIKEFTNFLYPEPKIETEPTINQTIITFSHDDVSYENWLEENGSGYVYNQCGGKEGSKTMNKIHRADCRHLFRKQDEGKRTTVFSKICSTNLEELEAHVQHIAGDTWVYCKSCF